MKLFSLSLLLSSVSASSIPSLVQRMTPDAPDGYTPTNVTCPDSRPSIRAADALSPQESSWLEVRRPQTVQPMRDLLTRINIPNFDAGSYIDNNSGDVANLPNIAIAASGGGWRALMNGAGALAAFDNRTNNNTGPGHLGGLLQSATYLAGLSGGSWLVGSLYANNFSSVQAILDTHNDLWDFSNNLLEGPPSTNPISYWTHLYDAAHGKDDAGYDLSLTDYWGRGLSYQLVNNSDGGLSYTFSSIANDSYFTAGQAPLPLVVADSRAPGTKIISGNATIFEFNPWEMGSWDPTLYAFAPLQFTGSYFDGGSIASDIECVRGFDNAGFVWGTSSTLFNQFILQYQQYVSDLPGFIQDAIKGLLTDFDDSENDISSWEPNPFYNYNDLPLAATQQLTLVDGGEDLQNVPFYPVIQPNRNVDVIFAIDSSADTDLNWPNGASIIATYERTLNASLENGTTFPYVPDNNTFINLGLNTRPTFFGCNSSNHTAGNNIPPLIVYLPNAPLSFFSNFSTFNLSTDTASRNNIIQNGLNAVSRGNSTLDSNWPVCVGCAILARSLERTNTAYPDACNDCFTNYCWNGTVDASTPAEYEPSLQLGANVSTAGSGVDGGSSGGGDDSGHGKNAAPASGLQTATSWAMLTAVALGAWGLM